MVAPPFAHPCLQRKKESRMSAWYRRGWGPRLLALALVTGLGASAGGCGKKPEPAPQQEDKPASTSPASKQAEPASERHGSAAVSEPAAVVVRDRLHQSFADA